MYNYYFFILIEFNDLELIVEFLKNCEDNLKGVFVDIYVVGEMLEFLSDEFWVNKIIDYNFYYGVVFGNGELIKILI